MLLYIDLVWSVMSSPSLNGCVCSQESACASRSVFLPRLLLSLPVSVNLHTRSAAPGETARPSFRGAPAPSSPHPCCGRAWGQRGRPPPGACVDTE